MTPTKEQLAAADAIDVSRYEGHTPEPWFDVLHEDSRPLGSIRDWWQEGTWIKPGEAILLTTRKELDAATACVNALAGIADPAAFMERAKAAMSLCKAQQAHDYWLGQTPLDSGYVTRRTETIGALRDAKAAYLAAHKG